MFLELYQALFFSLMTMQICNPQYKELVFNEKEKEENNKKGVGYYDNIGDDRGNVIILIIVMVIIIDTLSSLSATKLPKCVNV